MPLTESFSYDPLQCPRRQRITQNKRGHYVVDGKSMPGLCSRLKETFYPTFQAKYVCKKRKRNSEDPLERGKRVDRELIQSIRSGCLPCFHPYTKKILAAFSIWKYRIKEGQIRIFDAELNIATAIDLVVYNEQNDLIVLEIKTGFEGYHLKSTHFMENPLESFKNHACNQHFLQLGVMCSFLKKHYSFDSFDQAYVIRVDDKGVTRYKLPEWTKKEQIYTKLLERQKQKLAHDLFDINPNRSL